MDGVQDRVSHFGPAQSTGARIGRNEGRTLVVEAVDPVDRRRLVVAAEDKEVFRVLDLVREQEADRLERLLAPVDIIAEEEVVGLGRL